MQIPSTNKIIDATQIYPSRQNKLSTNVHPNRKQVTKGRDRLILDSNNTLYTVRHRKLQAPVYPCSPFLSLLPVYGTSPLKERQCLSLVNLQIETNQNQN
jgi:hypothetical protein